MKECYACVCVKEFPVQAMLRLRSELQSCPCVVMEGDPPLEQACSLNRRARLLGLLPGMTKVEVETFEQITILKRAGAEETTAREALLECAGTFSPRVEEISSNGVFVCVIDMAGTEKLFGPSDALAYKLLYETQRLGFSACVAISSQFHAAVIAAKGLTTNSPIKVISAGTEKAALADLPLSVLDLTPEQAEIFSLWGIRTLGALAALPVKGLIARLGQDGKRMHELAHGTRPHLFQAIEPSFTLSEHIEFDSPVEMLGALLFVVNTMLEQLILRATARVFALASVTITLKLEGGSTHTRTVKPALPTNDRQLWLKLMHLDLEAHPPQAAIMAATVSAEPGSTSKVQLGLFSPQLPEPSRLDITLARINALVGEGNAGCAVLNDSHALDSFRMEPFQVPSSRGVVTSSSAVRPGVRQIRPAEDISVTIQDSKPKAFFYRERKYTVERTYGPWLSSGDWWKPSLWGYEQWDLVANAQPGAAILYCCVMRDVLRNQWQMVGLYD